MKTILFIVDGISLPFHVIEQAIKKAKEGGYSVSGLFLKGEEEPAVGYAFPSDMKAAENLTTETEAVQEDEKIIMYNMELVKSMMDLKNVSYNNMYFTNPSAEKVATLASAYNFVIIDAAFDKKALLSSNLTLNDLTETIIVPVIPIAG